ncbi:MAG: hypothetical protein QCH96_07220, partial [Candidatus Thermoplasmatota archaeon]|nr:hypothetical protein [Candidatus Thermoplasmatota archaeon]
KDHRNIQADTYPLRLCIFPFYIFALLPVFTKHRIGHLLLGSEFDDQRCIPFHQGIPHYFGIYDQHQDFDRVMNTWYAKRIPSMVQWSAVRSISGLIVERILVNRYPTLSQLQRSCHSCHIDNDSIVPCGRCSKCLGVMLFLLANHIDPKLLNFQDIHIDNFQQQLETSSLRLDEDEKNHSLHLANISYGNQTPYSKDHVEMIHVDTYLCDPYQIPEPFRRSLYQLFERYTKGYCTLKTNEWIPILKEEVFPELS